MVTRYYEPKKCEACGSPLLMKRTGRVCSSCGIEYPKWYEDKILLREGWDNLKEHKKKQLNIFAVGKEKG